MRVSNLLAHYLPHSAGAPATVDNLSLLQYDAAFTMFVEAFVPWALNELQKNSLPQFTIQPGG